MNLTDVFLKIMNMSFTGAVVAVMILWVRLLYRVLPKKYLCMLWCVVLLRLLCPFTFPELGIGEPIQEPIPSNIMEVSEPYIASEIEVIDNTVNRVLEQNFIPEVGTSVNPMQIVMTIGSYLWIAGMIGMLLFTGWKLYQFYKTVREGVPDKKLDQRVYRCAVTTPVVIGILVPKIYLPFSLEEPQLSHVLVHEQMHIRRKDHILKLLSYIALIIHWFNPFVWIFYRLLERDMEMACDEAVLEKIGDDEKKNYCESLLDLASSKNHFVGNPVAFGESDVKLRIKNVLNYKKPRFWLSVIAIVILIITALNCLNGPKSAVEMTDVSYPLTKEVAEEAFEQVNLPGMVCEEEYDSEIRTSIDIRDEENRLIAGIASNGDGEKKGLFITLVPYLHSGSASVVLTEEKWEDLINFATLLYGFQDKSIVYKDFIKNYERQAIYTEYQYDEKPYYKEKYEWLKSYGDVTCQIEVSVATDGTKEISGICFYNTQEYSTVNSELAAKNFLYFMFTSISGRYQTYEKETNGKYDPINRDEMFLESEYSFAYLNQYKDRATENCLQTMEDFGYFTLIDYLAAQENSRVCILNASLTSADHVKNEKNVERYLYTVTLTNEKDGKINEFKVQGSIHVENMLNGWKATDFLLSDPEALSVHITGENVYYLDDTAQVSKVEHEMTETADWGIVLAVEDVTSKGLTLVCNQNDEKIEGELYSSSFYILFQYIDGEWVELEYILPENEIAWADGAWMISKGGAEEWEVNWETLYGELLEGQYRIGKKIMCSVPRNLETEWYYAEFVIGDNVQLNTKNQDEAFYEILCDAYYLGKVNGKEFAISSENGYGKGVFALYDIDGDGFDELLLNLTDESEQRTYAYIWGYNNGNTYVELCGGPLMNYYNNGIIEDGWSYKSESSGDFYPYSVYRYNKETDTYQSFGSVNAWDKKVSEINSEGKTFPSSIDADQDGIVYYILPSDWNGKYDIEPVDGNAYTNWRNGYLNGSEKISRFSAYELTEDYMKSVFEIKY